MIEHESMKLLDTHKYSGMRVVYNAHISILQFQTVDPRVYFEYPTLQPTYFSTILLQWCPARTRAPRRWVWPWLDSSSWKVILQGTQMMPAIIFTFACKWQTPDSFICSPILLFTKWCVPSLHQRGAQGESPQQHPHAAPSCCCRHWPHKHHQRPEQRQARYEYCYMNCD